MPSPDSAGGPDPEPAEKTWRKFRAEGKDAGFFGLFLFRGLQSAFPRDTLFAGTLR